MPSLVAGGRSWRLFIFTFGFSALHKAKKRISPTWILALVLFALRAIGQTVVGIQPFGTYTQSFDQISMSDLGIHMDIPLYEHHAR